MIDIQTTRRERATSNFFNKAPVVHNNKYDYCKVVYIDAVSKVIIICPFHGEFMQSPGIHVTSGRGCVQCLHEGLTRTDEEYTKCLAATNKGIRHIEKYAGAHTKILHEHTCGHRWHVTPNSMLRKNNCPNCSKFGFNMLQPAILYYLKVTNCGETAYKIGITNSSVQQRFMGDMKYIKVLKTWEYPIGAEAYQIEQTVLKTNKTFKYTGVPLLKSGNTELFYTDIGGFDHE